MNNFKLEFVHVEGKFKVTRYTKTIPRIGESVTLFPFGNDLKEMFHGIIYDVEYHIEPNGTSIFVMVG